MHGQYTTAIRRIELVTSLQPICGESSSKNISWLSNHISFFFLKANIQYCYNSGLHKTRRRGIRHNGISRPREVFDFL